MLWPMPGRGWIRRKRPSGVSPSLGGAGRDTNAKLGAGLEYAIDANLSVRGEWERYRLDTGAGKANTDLYSIGVKYAF